MEKILIELSAEILNATRLPPDEVEEEVRKELALALYRRGILSLGKARLLARMTRWDFDALLGQRKVPRHYAATDLEEDLLYGFGRQ